MGGGGGISIYTARPAWQTGSGISSTADPSAVSGTGIAAGSPITGLHRLVPDIAFIAASGHAATAFCAEGVCSDTSTGYGIGAVGGTSVATPVMAACRRSSIKRTAVARKSQLLLLSSSQLRLRCRQLQGRKRHCRESHRHPTCGHLQLSRHRGWQQCGQAERGGHRRTRLQLRHGFDAASGLGSVNINNVATNWSKVSFRATTTTFTLSPTIVAHAASQLFSATVAASSGTGTPTGDISIIAVTTNPSEMLQYTLSGGTYSGSINGLPAGSYNVYVHYAGDGTFAPSNSALVPVTISTQGSTVTNTLNYITAGSQLFSGATAVPYGSVLFINSVITPNPAGSSTIPTGKLTYSVTLNGASLPSVVQIVDGYGDASFQSGANSTPLYLVGNYPVLSSGTYVVTASYSGDSTYSASSTSTAFAVTQIAPTVALTTSATYIASAGSVTLNYSVTRPSGTYLTPLAAYPTGSAVFTDTTTGVVLGTAPLNAAGLATLTTTAITASGANTISAVYTGDANYTTTTSTTPITVGTLTATTTTLSVAANTYYVGTTVPLTATVTPAVSAKVSFYDGSTLLGTATSSATTGIATLSATATTTALTAGTHSLSAVFTGTTTYAASTGTTSLTISQNLTSLVIDAPTASTYGQTISMNGRISRSPSVATPVVGLTGTVTFKDGSTTIATATPVYVGSYAYYTATVSLTTLTAGTHTLSAVYNGDTNYATSTSATVTTTVAQLTPVITLSSPATVYNGASSVPLTATIPLASALAAPTGLVVFYDGSTVVGSTTATYSSAAGGYVATVTLTGQSSGTHSYTAVLAADYNYNSSTSAVLSVLFNTNNVWIANGKRHA